MSERTIKVDFMRFIFYSPFWLRVYHFRVSFRVVTHMIPKKSGKSRGFGKLFVFCGRFCGDYLDRIDATLKESIKSRFFQLLG